MANFKEQAFADISNVFFNPEEFGESHEVDGRQMTVVIESGEEAEHKLPSLSSMVDGIYDADVVLYAKRNEFGKLPGHGRIITVDGMQYRLLSARDEAGVYTLKLKRARAV